MNASFGIGFVSGLGALVLAGGLFVVGGGMPVATKGDPLPLERLIAHTALSAAMKGQTSQPSPLPSDDMNLGAGAKIYKTNCAVCHGLPGGEKSYIAQGLFPLPPQLFPPGHGVTDDDVGESYWKIKNGIRLTGMPGFVGLLSDTEMWQVSMLVHEADKLSPKVQAALASK
jgi:thiosulfate dehydrogenase